MALMNKEQYLASLRGGRTVYYRGKRVPDVTADPELKIGVDLGVLDIGGYHAVLAIHAEGSVEAEKMQILRSYDSRRALSLARKFARLG